MPAGSHDAVVVGAGPAGLAAGAMLQARGFETRLLEQSPRVGDGWRRHYDRLHLHTVRRLSGQIPRGLRPTPRSPDRPRDPRRADRSGRRAWALRTDDGDVMAGIVVVATGYNRIPRIPPWPGREWFAGRLIHSSEYRKPEPFRGTDVLVVGTGNSGAEIAVDLVEGGARTVWLSFRTPPNILRRDLFGLPTQALGVVLRRLPPGAVDAVARVTQRVTVGDLSPYGMPPPPRGVYTRLREDDIVPILDVGLIGMLRRRRVTPAAGVTAFDGVEVGLADGTRLRPDAVIAATGYQRGLEPLVGHLGILGPHGRPVVHGPSSDPRAPGLHFIGYTNPISGNLREVGIDARRLARAVAGRRSAAA